MFHLRFLMLVPGLALVAATPMRTLSCRQPRRKAVAGRSAVRTINRAGVGPRGSGAWQRAQDVLSAASQAQRRRTMNFHGVSHMMKTLTAAVALTAGLAAPALAFDVTAMSDAEREAFRAEVRAYLLENPDVIFDAVDVAEQRQAEQMAAGDEQLVTDNAGAIFDDGYSWVGGNPDADITVVEFMDYRCGYCRKAHDEVAELIEGDGNVRLIVKEFPILGEASMISTRFALAVRMVAGDDAYEAARDALIALTSEMSEPVLRRLADSLDLDADAVLAAMDDPEITRQIESTRALAQTLAINGTPTFVMGTQLVRGYVPLDTMQQIVEEERSEG